MQMDAVWLLRNYRYLLSRQKFLQTLIPALASQSIADEEIIESITYLREGIGAQSLSRTSASRTEYAAIHLDALRDKQERGQSVSTRRWHAELETLHTLLQIYDIAISILTKEEQNLVEKYYNEGLPLSSLENAPLSDDGYVKSRSTLKRMLKKIENKMAAVLSLQIG